MKLVYRKLSAWLLAVLGVSGCSFPELFVCMYGCHVSDFKINASVTDEDGTPVAGIEAMALENQSGEYYQLSEASKTDADGKVQIASSFSSDSLNGVVAVAFKDADGDANGGTFKADTVKNIQFTRTREGKGKWDLGDYEANISVKLNEQK